MRPPEVPYVQLTDAGKLRRLRQIAIAAVAQYDLPAPRIDYFGWATNLMYKVTTQTGQRFMLRIASPGWRTLDDLRSEALWVNALARDTRIPVPSVVPTRRGELVQTIGHPGVPEVRNVTLMTWVPGRLLAHNLSETNLVKMGELFAAMHDHGARWVPPPGFTTRRFEHWLSRDEDCLIVERSEMPAVTHASVAVQALPSAVRTLLDQLHVHVEEAYAALDRADLRIIHCDLWHENIKVHRGVLHPFDFEDTVWGFRAHDIAMATLDLLETTGDERYGQLLASFRHGYESSMTWPLDPIDPLQIGRLLWKFNWFALRRPQRLSAVIDLHLPLLQHYVSTGRVTRPPVL
jgi:Ser/Thr protein kinase RdoA (MazF antagonist)